MKRTVTVGLIGLGVAGLGLWFNQPILIVVGLSSAITAGVIDYEHWYEELEVEIPENDIRRELIQESNSDELEN